MPHIDPERLALLALGEPVASNENAEHLSHCVICVDDLTALRHVALAGRATLDIGDLEAPRDEVWQRIAGELSLASANPRRPAVLVPVTTSPEPTHAPALPVRRGRRWVGWVLAAVIVVVAGVGIGAWALAQQPSQTEVAQASLTAFPAHAGAAGSAVVEEDSDGSMVVRVELTTTDAAPDTFREVWLITADASALVSLGVLDGTRATFPIPAGVDLRDYVLVDISQEPDDGNVGHSGDSIVRGELAFL